MVKLLVLDEVGRVTPVVMPVKNVIVSKVVMEVRKGIEVTVKLGSAMFVVVAVVVMWVGIVIIGDLVLKFVVVFVIMVIAKVLVKGGVTVKVVVVKMLKGGFIVV